MPPLFSLAGLLAYWREYVIIALGLTLAFAVHSCKHNAAEVVRIKTEDQALANAAQAHNDEIRKHDQEASDNAKATFQSEIDRLNADHRIASIPICVRNPASSSSAVRRETVATVGAATEARTELSPAPTRDIGPAIDELTRECDKIVVANNELIHWLLATH